MAISDSEKVSPIETMTAPTTTLNMLTLLPNQNANWCQGLPCRAPAGMWSMCRFSTYRLSGPLRAADTAICGSPFPGSHPFPGRLPAQLDDRLLCAGPAVPRHALPVSCLRNEDDSQRIALRAGQASGIAHNRRAGLMQASERRLHLGLNAHSSLNTERRPLGPS